MPDTIANPPILENYEPGNGTRYQLCAFKVDPLDFPAIDHHGIFVAWIGHGSFMFAPAGFLHASYVREKLGGSPCDATAIAEWIGKRFEREAHGTCDCGRHGA